MSVISGFKGFIARPVVFFTASRYFSYGLLFLRGLLVAKLLGPYFFGIWGFVTLYQQYLSLTSLGIQYAINTELALLGENDRARTNSLINVSFTLTLGIVLIITLVAVVLQLLEVDIFGSDGSYRYIILTFLIGALTHFRELFSNIFRVFNDYWRIALGEIIIAVITLVVVFFFNDEQLIIALLVSWVFALVVSVVLFAVKAPFRLRLSLKISEVKVLLSVGLPLLFYSISYYLMTLSSRTIVSMFYDLETVGHYTFAFTITNAVLLGINAASWVVYPSMLSKMKEGTEQNQLLKTINRVSSLYGISVAFVVYVGILVSPLLYILLEEYRPASAALNILMLAQVVLALGFVFNTLAIARRKQNQVAIISLVCTALSFVLGLTFAWLKLDLVWFAVATLLSYCVYTIAITLYAFRILNAGLKLRQFFPPPLLCSLALVLAGCFFNYSVLFYFAGLAILVFTSWRDLLAIMELASNQKSRL